MRHRKLSVGDLFCGAGGFSEGFRQAGFEVKWAVEFWKPAILTYQKNNPQTKLLPDDILTLSEHHLPPVDVVIGSPPCTQFSPANRGGNGNKEQGLKLAMRFFEIVKQLQPKYWILENVPALRFSLAEEIKAGQVDTGAGSLRIPRISVLDAEDFGTPQRRRRLFMGDYPEILPIDSGDIRMPRTLEDVLRGLPDPTRSLRPSHIVRDPLYPWLKIPEANLRDHFEDTRWWVRPENIDLARVAKEEHRWLGKMVFPDPRNRPCRTITGAHSTTSRSSIIFRYRKSGRNPYRTLTLREAATIQGFPISYQFWHDSFGGKDQLVGNAVPVPVARGLAHAILRNEGLPIPAQPLLHSSAELPEPISVKRGRVHRFGPNRRFRIPVPIDVRHECRVELDNSGRRPSPPASDGAAPAKRWVTRLYLGYAKEYLCYELSLRQVLEIIKQLPTLDENGRPLRQTMTNLVREARRAFDGRLPDSASLQSRWTERTPVGPPPYAILSRVARLVNQEVPKRTWKGDLVPEPSYLHALGNPIESGRGAPTRPTEGLPVRVLGAVSALAVACETINREGIGSR